jgi:poly-gamma-glutamate capsule biosynthesis protein CapA/YwtB (metallophosphatase superfamily)
MADKRVVLLGCGDVGPTKEPLDTYSSLARPTLSTADIRFGECERVYSERGSFQLQSDSPHSRVPPHLASVFSDCGFDVISLASNHAMDWGEEGLLDNIELFRQKGIKTVGGGANIEEARRPAIIEKNGVKVAFLGYCSVPQEGCWAEKDKVGVAPLRADTFYKPVDYQPGVAPRVITIPYEEDIAAMVDDIARAKKASHAVVVSIHWGIHFVPRVIADYQPIVAKAAFAAGADLILGHHPHVPKAVGVHGGKVCFYSLGNFIMSAGRRPHDAKNKFYGAIVDDDHPADTRRSLIAKAVLTPGGVEKVSFLPVLIDKQLRPEILRNGDPRFDDMVGYMDWTSGDFDHQFKVEGDEVVVTS